MLVHIDHIAYIIKSKQHFCSREQVVILCVRKGNEMREKVAIHDIDVESELESAGGHTARDFLF